MAVVIMWCILNIIWTLSDAIMWPVYGSIMFALYGIRSNFTCWPAWSLWSITFTFTSQLQSPAGGQLKLYTEVKKNRNESK